MNFKEKLLYATGIMMIVWGLFLSLGGIIEISEGSSTLAGGLALTIMFGVLPIFVGLMLCRRMKAQSRRRKIELNERSIMMLAAQHNGRLTASELAMHTELSVAEALQLLEGYMIQGITSLGVSESGAKVFHFHELISDDEKLRAEEL